MLGRERAAGEDQACGQAPSSSRAGGGLCRMYPLSYHLLGRRVADEAGPMPRATHALHLYPCSSGGRRRR